MTDRERRARADRFRRMPPDLQAKIWAALEPSERFDLLAALPPRDRAALEERLGGLGVGV